LNQHPARQAPEYLRSQKVEQRLHSFREAVEERKLQRVAESAEHEQEQKHQDEL
jgi:hypothetical protein